MPRPIRPPTRPTESSSPASARRTERMWRARRPATRTRPAAMKSGGSTRMRFMGADAKGIAYHAARMNIEVRKSDDVVIVDFTGRLAVGVGDEVLPQVIDEILDEGFKKILLNLSEMDYIDSNGLGELVQSLKRSK